MKCIKKSRNKDVLQFENGKREICSDAGPETARFRFELEHKKFEQPNVIFAKRGCRNLE
jgi:hypothetical protein